MKDQFFSDIDTPSTEGYLDRITEVVDLPMTLDRGVKDIHINVKRGFVSSIVTNMWKINFFLGERLRLSTAEVYGVSMDGK